MLSRIAGYLRCIKLTRHAVLRHPEQLVPVPLNSTFIAPELRG
jgi:hypothetical protein